jgi:HEAT repeat protein
MDGDDRPVATEWAGRLGVHDAIPVLTELAETEGAVARGAAMRALGRLKAVGAEERLLRIAGDPGAPEDLRLDAAEGLAELGTPAALDQLRQLSAEGPEELRQLCQELLVEVQTNAG